MPLFTQPVQPWLIPQEGLQFNASSGVLTANGVYLYAFEVYATVTITQMTYKMAATATGTVDLGLYDSNGNLLGHTGATNTVANAVTTLTLLSSVTLSPGRYWMALCPSNATDTYSRANGFGAGALTRCYTATNTGTSGVLPSTTGGQASAGTFPDVTIRISGGL